MAVYEVRVSGPIERRGPGHDRRRRGGIEFGPVEKLVSTVAGPGVHLVTEEQLEAVLADQHLRAREVAPPASLPEPLVGTAGGEGAPSADEQPDEPEAADEAPAPSDEPAEEEAAAEPEPEPEPPPEKPPTKKRGRHRRK